MPMYSYRLNGTIEVPDGSKLNDTATGIILPDGKEIKLWEAVEMCTPGGDDHRDLSSIECERRGIFYDGDMCEFEQCYDADEIAKLNDVLASEKS